MVYRAVEGNIGYAVEINQGIISGKNAWISGALSSVTGTDMNVAISSGSLLYNKLPINITGATVTISAADTVNPRLDLIVWNGSALVVIPGTPNVNPVPADYNIDTTVVLDMVLVNANVTAITSGNITDYRTEAVIGGGLKNFTQSFTNVTAVVVNHNLNDLQPTVTVVDSTNNILNPSSITITNANSLVVNFAVLTTGVISVKGGQFTAQASGVPVASTNGNMLVDNGTSYTALPVGSSGQVLTTDGTNVLWGQGSAPTAKHTALLSYRTLQANNTFVNGDGLVVDEFTTAAGTNSTKTSGIAAFGGTKLVLPNGAGTHTTPLPNASGSTVGTGLVFTMSTVNNVFINSLTATLTNGSFYVKFIYTDGTSYQSVLLGSTGGSFTFTGSNPNPTKSVAQAGIGIDPIYGGTVSFASGYYTSNNFALSGTAVCNSNTQTLTGAERNLLVYSDKTLPTNTSMTVDISDGTTTLAAQPFDTVIDISTLGAGTLSLTFNLATTDTAVTPSLKGYGVYIN